MKDKDIYKTQDQFIADWLDILSQKNKGKQRARQRGADEDLEISQSEADDILNKKLQRTLEHEVSKNMPFLKLIKKLKLNFMEIKIILYLYLGYIESGFQRGETLLSILDLLTESPGEAFLLRRKLKQRNILLQEDLLVRRDRGGGLFRNRNDLYLSPKTLALLEQEEIAAEKDDKKKQDNKLFEILQPRKSLQDVVLKERTRNDIKGILKQIEQRTVFMQEWGLADKFEKGKGLIMLFHGSPGTGKTLTAEAVAHELDYQLYTVSLADVLDPYYGVTEKNIKRIFDKADGKECILLLDEVDAFISKRSKGSSYGDSAHNRKVSLFLRLLENFEGVAVMTTNLPTILDKALERRISIKIEFPRPDRGMREALWQKLMPQKLPLATDINLKVLAKKYELSGGEIKNVIMNAARKSLLKKEALLTQQDLIESIEREHIDNKFKIGFLG